MNRGLCGMFHRRIAILLSVILVVCLAGAGEICDDDPEIHITALRTCAADSVEFHWKEQEVNILRCIPYLGSGLRTRDMVMERVHGVRIRQLGAAFFATFFAALLSVMFKVTAICCCMLVWIQLYLKIDDCHTAILLYLHDKDGKKRLISC